MIIGISGKIGSGKDTVADMIKFISQADNPSFAGWQDNNFRIHLDNKYPSDFEIKKFADKLKDIVCLLIGCTREDLENHEFKNSPLGEDWIRYAYADGMFPKSDGGKIMWSRACTKEKYEEEHITNWQTAYKEELTPRRLLQFIGTELFREQLLKDIWINALFADYIPNVYWMCDKCLDTNINNLIEINSRFEEEEKEWVCPNCKGKEKEGDITQVINDNASNWIISDMRFPNELEAIKKRNGITIRIERPLQPGDKFIWEFDSKEYTVKWSHINMKMDGGWCYYTEEDPHGYIRSSEIITNEHESETALDDANFDCIIKNDSDLEGLFQAVKLTYNHIMQQ